MSAVVIGLVLIALAIAPAIWHARDEGRKERDAAMRRHPSARPSTHWMSDAEREYHTSNRLGRT